MIAPDQPTRVPLEIGAGTPLSVLGKRFEMAALALSPGELQGSAWSKGGLQRGRFRARMAKRLGHVQLVVLGLDMRYTVRSQRTCGSFTVISSWPVAGGMRSRAAAFGAEGDPLDLLSDVSDERVYRPAQ